MPKQKTYSRDDLARAAMMQFWHGGYEATSMDDLVKVTGVSRHGIYADYGGKRALFLDSFRLYDQDIVTPAFAAVEARGAGWAQLQAYFYQQIALAEQTGLPGPGCLVANSATEVAPHDDAVRALVDVHLQRLRAGFANILANEQPALDRSAKKQLVEAMVIFTQGLWSMSRVTDKASVLRAASKRFVMVLKS